MRQCKRNVWRAEGPAELGDLVEAINCRVPRRFEGRTTPQVERYALARVIATLPESEWAYPIEVEHRDRPDFTMRFGGNTVGIEHSEVVAPNAIRRARIEFNDGEKQVVFLRRSQPGERRKSVAELRHELLDDPMGDGWIGDSAEREWAAAMAHAATAKAGVAAKEGFVKFARSWLVLYDNWEVPSIGWEIAIPLLRAELASTPVWEVFDRVIVLDDANLAHFPAGELLRVAKIGKPQQVGSKE